MDVHNAKPNGEAPCSLTLRHGRAAVCFQTHAGQPASPYVGVSWAKQERRWMATIQHEGRTQRLGLFVEEEAAAWAFDVVARQLRGENAHGGGDRGRWRLNFPTEAEAAGRTQPPRPRLSRRAISG